MLADVEVVVAIIRAGRDYQGRAVAAAGGPGYDFAATAIIRGDTAEIIGGVGSLTPALVREIERALGEHGITSAHWVRYGRQRPRTVERVAR
ncbi:hypothetical protein [Pedomonas sp. V897]|uniref:hypothetical protein n=1 Tax=Pedomonas sp. V897 TaxID=3446482 RepID=UPI003EE1FF8B